jgi:RNA polymerase sigma-70 factor (ECF subfamily)
MIGDADTFESHRPALLALAYRMLGDVGRAEEMVQDAWLRWAGRTVEVDAPKPYLLKVVARLCLNELDSARARREESRGGRLPEPIDLSEGMLGRLEVRDQVSMAFLVVLQRLTPAERAVLLLREVFDFEHHDIAELLDKTEAASRQLLRRAKEKVTMSRGAVTPSGQEHQRLTRAFLEAASSGNMDGLLELLAADAEMIVDGGPDGARIRGIRNLPKPIFGAHKIAAFVAAFARRPDTGAPIENREWELNGQPAIIALQGGRPIVALLLGVSGGRIQQVFIQADPHRLEHIGALN